MTDTDKSKPRILLVDDDIDFAESQAEFLEIKGFHITLAFSGEEGLKRVQEAEFDMVLLDMKMPGMNGIECLVEMRKLKPGIRVAMVSAFTQQDFVNQALQSGALAVISKPVVLANLLDTLSFLGAQASILMVEDEADLREVMASTLREVGYAVDVVATYQKATEALDKKGYDLLLLDFALPDGTGADLLKHISNNNRPIKTMIITGYPTKAIAELPWFSMEDMMVKPFDPEQLLLMIQRNKIGAKANVSP